MFFVSSSFFSMFKWFPCCKFILMTILMFVCPCIGSWTKLMSSLLSMGREINRLHYWCTASHNAWNPEKWIKLAEHYMIIIFSAIREKLDRLKITSHLTLSCCILQQEGLMAYNGWAEDQDLLQYHQMDDIYFELASE